MAFAFCHVAFVQTNTKHEHSSMCRTNRGKSKGKGVITQTAYSAYHRGGVTFVLITYNMYRLSLCYTGLFFEHFQKTQGHFSPQN